MRGQPQAGIPEAEWSPEQCSDPQLRAVHRRIIERGDRARSTLARDLHDGAQQQFLAAVINARRAQQKWSVDPLKAKQLLDASVAQAKTGLRTLRELVAGTDPGILSERGLRAAIDALVANLPLPVFVDVPSDSLPRELRTSLYFFTCEALTNVVRHAQASRADVRIALLDWGVVAEVSDDGIGGALTAARGTGLEGLSERVTALGGELEIISSSERGTTLRARIPRQPD